jgi:hypothetical protein
VFRADIPLIESKPCFEGNFIAKLVLKVNLVLKTDRQTDQQTDRPTDRRTSRGLDASSRGIKRIQKKNEANIHSVKCLSILYMRTYVTFFERFMSKIESGAGHSVKQRNH